jgi:hypothetical protein
MRRFVTFTTMALLALAGTACEQVKSYNPLSPDIAGPIPWVQISPPTLVQPQQGATFKPDQQPVTLVVENAASNGPRPLYYTFEIAADSGFTNIVVSREKVEPGEDGRTNFRLEGNLQIGRNYFWRARAADGANTGPYSAIRHFEVQEPVVLQAPVLVSPKANALTTTLQPMLTALNAARSGPHGVLFYQFEVALDQAFAARVYDGDTLEGAGQTSVTPSVVLPVNTQLFWRVRVNDGRYVSPWSNVESFRTPSAPAAPPPGPSPSPGPAPPPSNGSCAGAGSPLGILQCHRAQYPGGQLHGSDAVNFLTASAIDFNKVGVNGGGFGILVKEGGNNCNGFSCDILCQGQGSGQKQYDVLRDETEPQWGPPLDGQLRIDVCVVK